MNTGHERGLSGKELMVLLARLRNINRLAAKGLISAKARLKLHDMLIPGIWCGHDKLRPYTGREQRIYTPIFATGRIV